VTDNDGETLESSTLDKAIEGPQLRINRNHPAGALIDPISGLFTST
jgi:hypothetical protein